MVYRPCPDPTPPTAAAFDTVEIAQAAIVVERGERHLRLLAELAEIAMGLARSLGEVAQARLETVKAGEGEWAPGEDPGAAFTPMSQTVRRTLDLEARLADCVDTRRAGLAAARSARRAMLGAAHKAAMDKAIDAALTDSFQDVYAEPEADELTTVLAAAENLRCEFDEFRDYLDRPVGETVAKLCAILRLDPTSCVRDGETWKVRRRPRWQNPRRDPLTGETDYETDDGTDDDLGPAPSSTGPPP
jgi:hypothetical protein